jgi:hypothetical protein
MSTCIRHVPTVWARPATRHLPAVEARPGRCVVAGQHLADCGDCGCACHASIGPVAGQCDEPGGCYARHAACAGCRPDPAAVGLLCRRCWRRLADLLGDREEYEDAHRLGLAAVWELMRDAVAPGAGAADDRRRGTAAPPAPLNVGALDLSREIPTILRFHVWHAAELLSTPAPITEDGQPPSPYRCEQWLRNRLADICGLPMIAGLWSDAAELAGRAHAVRPWRGLAQVLHGVPCPQCAAVGSLVAPAGEDDAKCGRCGLVVDYERRKNWMDYLAGTLRFETCSACRVKVAQGRDGEWVKPRKDASPDPRCDRSETGRHVVAAAAGGASRLALKRRVGSTFDRVRTDGR